MRRRPAGESLDGEPVTGSPAEHDNSSEARVAGVAKVLQDTYRPEISPLPRQFVKNPRRPAPTANYTDVGPRRARSRTRDEVPTAVGGVTARLTAPRHPLRTAHYASGRYTRPPAAVNSADLAAMPSAIAASICSSVSRPCSAA